MKFENILKKFKSLSLTELNASASFLKRIDTKFLMSHAQLDELLGHLHKDFRILEMGENRIFTYDNIYMDTRDYFFYTQHQKQKYRRSKIRTRLYTDSNRAFFEYKQKQGGLTRKFRYEFPPEEHGIMTKGKTRFFDGVWQSFYEGTTTPVISPSIRTHYRRITLVSMTGEERFTIDFDIETQDLRSNTHTPHTFQNLVIVESKALNRHCKSLRILKKLGHTPAPSCSKYSLGVIYAGIAEKYSTFKKTIAAIKRIRKETVKNTQRFRTHKLTPKQHA